MRKHLLLVYRVRNAANGREKRTQRAKISQNRLNGPIGPIWMRAGPWGRARALGKAVSGVDSDAWRGLTGATRVLPR